MLLTGQLPSEAEIRQRSVAHDAGGGPKRVRDEETTSDDERLGAHSDDVFRKRQKVRLGA
jgi:hypothetical protein